MRCGMRLHFYKNSKQIRAALALKNDTQTHMVPYEIDGFHWEFDTTLKEAPAFNMSGSDGHVVGAVDEQAALVQGYSDFRSPDGDFDSFGDGPVKDRWIPDKGYAIYRWSQIGPRKLGASSGGGPDGNLMHADIYLLNLIRSGIGGYYLLTDNLIDAMCDAAVQHAHDYNLSEGIGNSNNSYDMATGRGARGAKRGA